MKKLTLALLITAAASQASAVQMNLVSVETQNWERLQAWNEWNESGTIGGQPSKGYAEGNIDGGVIYPGGVGQPFSATTAVFDFDGTTLTSAGEYNVMWWISPNSILYERHIQDLSIVMGGVASATSYTCHEGNFGGYIGANLCGNYTLGDNFYDESSMTYNVDGDAGNQFLALGGDDAFFAPAQALSDFDNTTINDDIAYAGMVNATGQLAMSSYSWNGSILKIHNMNGNITQTLTFSAVPVPAAAWLFGSALLGLAGLKRK